MALIRKDPEVPGSNSRVENILKFIKKNAFTVIMGVFIVVITVNPNAKAWFLQQLMHTGIFNAKVSKEVPDEQAAASFAFENERGIVENTSSLRGKVVFINFWASWCPPCRAEFPSIEKLYSRFNNHPEVFFLMLNEDSDPAAARAYLDKENLTMPLYKMNGNAPSSLYSGSLPTTIILDKQGKVRFRHEGFANYAAENFIRQIEELISE